MTLSRSNPRARMRWGLLGAIVATITLGLATMTLAVHDLGLFELDGNTANLTSGPNSDGDDWANLYHNGGTPANGIQSCTASVTESCFEAFALDPDKIGSTGDNSYFTGGGSKDRLDVSSWQWTGNDQSPDKNDIVNAFSAAYHDGDGNLVIYFGADRYAVNGDAQMGFWFFQTPVCLAGAGGDCPSSTPNQTANTGKFVDPTTGAPANHTDGDILALVNFNNGGTLGLAGVYRWSGGVNGAPSQVLFGDGVDCALLPSPSSPEDDFCSTANKGALGAGEPPWSYTGKGKNITTYPTSAFIEGGFNLGNVQGAGTCFPTFMAETRSSSGPSTGLSLDAQLKDFALHSFQRCGSELTTTPKNGTGGALADADNDSLPDLSIGTGLVSVKDSADLAVTGISSWSGNLDFYLCGPISSGTCDGTDNTGTHIGTSIAVSDASPNPVSSIAATISSVGRYCWRADFDSSTSGVPDASDGTSGECFEVLPVTPPLDTAAVASSVDFGQAVQDNATLSGTATQPGDPIINGSAGSAAGGKITFTLLKSDCSTAATGTGTNPQDVTVSGNDTYGPVSFTPDSPGTYHWKAVYAPASSDPNNLGSTHNGSCNDTDETVVVNQVQTGITTRQFVFPQDKATVTATGGGNLAGSVTFKLYDTMTNCSANGAAGLLYSEGPLSVSGASPQSKTTANTTARITSNTTVYWRVSYASTNQAQLGSVSTCTETTAVTYVGNDGTITVP